MNWFGTQKVKDLSINLLALALAFAVIIDGSGKFSLDDYSQIPSKNNNFQALYTVSGINLRY